MYGQTAVGLGERVLLDGMLFTGGCMCISLVSKKGKSFLFWGLFWFFFSLT